MTNENPSEKVPITTHIEPIGFKPSTLEEVKEVESFKLFIWLFKLIALSFVSSAILIFTTFGYFAYSKDNGPELVALRNFVIDFILVIKTILKS